MWKIRFEYATEASEQWGLTFEEVIEAFEGQQRFFGYPYRVEEVRPHYCRLLTQYDTGKSSIIIKFDGFTDDLKGESLTDVFHLPKPYTLGYDVFDAVGIVDSSTITVEAGSEYLAYHVANREISKYKPRDITIRFMTLETDGRSVSAYDE